MPLKEKEVGFSTICAKFALNVARTAIFEFIATVQLPVPEQAPPDQPVKVEPESADGNRVTDELAVKDAEHVEPQLIPVGAE